MPFVDALFEAVKDDEIGWTAARAIGEIAAADAVLTKKNHAIVKVSTIRVF
jgi:DNA repair/transcription protein MET18/MMS19